MIFLLCALLSDCQSCHAKQAAEWQGSRHAAAFTNTLFAESYAREPRRWCLGCHAPGKDLKVRRVADAKERVDGVDCVACHVRDGKLVSARELAAPEFCGRCHQFNFPGQTEVMQDTFAEWRRSGAAQTCQECHMPSGAHTFPGAHDVEFLRRAVKVQVSPSKKGVVVRLASRGAAHRVPTGDPFRRLFVELCDEPGCEEPLASPSFGRAFIASGEGWRLRTDTTLQPGVEARREVATRARKLYWRLRYGFAAGSSAPSLSEDDWAVTLAGGVVAR